jgi:hypothetical protein
MDWECAWANASFGNTAACDWLLGPLLLASTYTDPTLMVTRNVVSFLLPFTQAGAAIIGFGLIAWDGVDDNPPAGCPGPITGCNMDWISRVVVPIPAGLAPSSFMGPVVDQAYVSKARRRLPTQTGLLLVWEGQGLNGFVESTVDVRCLIKE